MSRMGGLLRQMPLAGSALLMALFVGWFASKDIWREQLATSARIFAVCWLPVMRFVVPPAIASIMVISMLG